MADNSSTRLREQAAHCRKLAKALNDRRSIEALHLTAREFEDQAERLEAAGVAAGYPATMPRA